jgi:glycosyltransferase involved in cell wall biosynthesis
VGDKEVWLITHDNYIDRRIFFFADVFQENGCEVKLFPSTYFELNTDPDPLYVRRPVKRTLVKDYSFEINSLEDRAIRETMELLIDRQEDYHRVNGKYAKRVRELGIRTRNRFGITVKTIEDTYIIIISKKEYRLFYSNLTGKYQYSHIGNYAPYEDAISKIVKDNSEEINKCFIVNGIEVRAEYNEWGELIYRALRPGETCIYEYNCEEEKLYEEKLLQHPRLCLDEVLGQTFDFVDFKELLYDYSCIMERIKEELKVKKPDIVYVADLPTLPVGIILKRLTGCELIVDCHEWWFQQTMLWEGYLKNKVELAERYEKEFYPQCDICITVGELLAHDMTEYYGRKFYTIYSCMCGELSLKQSKKSDSYWQDRFDLPEKCQVAIFQGGLTTLRNLDNLARATRYLKDHQYLAIVGSGGYLEEFQTILKKEGKEDRVRFVGWVKQTELNQYAVNADVGIIPYHATNSYYAYSVPNKLMEYCETQTPIFYDETMKEIDRVVSKKEVGRKADLSDPERFGRGLSEMLEDREYLMWVREAYASQNNEFGFEVQKIEFQKILEELDSEKKQREKAGKESYI